jgi:endonuclease/exonuclease/phosphatase family metal-dependent hydrolase
LGISIIAILFSLKAKAQQITVMTYNIYHGEQRYDQGKSNLKQIADVINLYQPDFVALQEVDSMTNRSASFNNGNRINLVQELSTLTGMYGFFGKAIDYSEGGYGEGILSRFPVKHKNYNLPIPKGGEIRALLMVEHTFSGGQKIIFAGTHLCHEFAENRLVQTTAIRDIFTDISLPVIMGGDFNATPESEPYKVIRTLFDDTAVIKGDPQNTISYENPRSRIDYIFVSKNCPWIIKDVRVIRNNASDHMPVLVTLELQK